VERSERDRDALAASDGELAALAAELDEIAGLLADYTAARELATARLVVMSRSPARIGGQRVGEREVREGAL
jgi:hypothetical protein